MKKVIALLVASFAVFAAVPETARAAGQCGLPDHDTMWIDFADGSVPFWSVFAKPGVIAAAAQLIYPPQLRAGGANTVYFDLYFRNRVGTGAKPADPKLIEERANRFFEYAQQSTGCAQPLAAFNELQGAAVTTPWSDAHSQYRDNVLRFLKVFAERGGRPFLLISGRPYTGGEAANWWREVAKHADLVREVYFPATRLHRQGPDLASRNLRQAFRRAAADLIAIGIPPRKIGIMLGFQTSKGTGGREGLKPASAWYETVKWQALAAKQVSNEFNLATVWSWGWGVWNEGGNDPEKLGAACVWLWTRNPQLCNAPGAVGTSFDPDLKEGQLTSLPGGVQCTVADQRILTGAISRLARVTGNREVAFSALYQRAAESRHVRIPHSQVLAAEQAVIAFRFNGNPGAYRAALARRRANVEIARGVLADELRRVTVKRRLDVAPPSSVAITEYYGAYASVLTREVEVARSRPHWLGGRERGMTIASLAPPPVFTLRDGAERTISWAGTTYVVRALSAPVPLGALPLPLVKPAISAALTQFAKTAAYHSWTARRQEGSLGAVTCRRDLLPQPGEIELAEYLPFLALS